MICRRGICHAIQGAILGILIGHAITIALFPSKKNGLQMIMLATAVRHIVAP